MHRSYRPIILRSQLSLGLLALAISFVTLKAHAEWIYHIDSTGKLIQVDTEDPNSPYRIPPQGPTKRLKGTAIAFSVTYADVTMGNNFGFDEPIQGPRFQSVVENVLAYIDSVLDETGAVDILFEESQDDPNANLLAAAGPIFNDVKKFTNGFAFDHITTGIDPNPVSVDITAKVNFGHNWFTGSGNPLSNQIDLFSVLLHEITHGLGILSFSDDQGQGALPNVYSVWDSYLERGNVVAEGFFLTDIFAYVRDPTFVGAASDLVSENVFFRGPASNRSAGGLISVFAPPDFNSFSSLAHFDDSLPDTVVMRPSIAPGLAIRQYAEFELAALQDLGYTVAVNQFCEPLDVPPIKKEILPTQLSSIPWDPEPLRQAGKVVYGNDDRKDVFEETDPTILQLAASTCAVVNSVLLSNVGGSISMLTFSYMPPVDVFGATQPPCDDEPFKDQPAASECSAVLVGPDIVITAGHCFWDSFSQTFVDPSEKSFVFGYDMTNQTTPVTNFNENQVYAAVELISVAFDENFGDLLDYAVVRLDRQVTAPGAIPLEIRRSGQATLGLPLGMIGHPNGLPKKIAFGDAFVTANCNDVFFVANLDSYQGNSGSPVFNATTGIVEGIIVRGSRDFIEVFDPVNCALSNRLPNHAGAEDVTKTTAFASFVPLLVNPAGALALDKTSYRCGETIAVLLTDSDLQGAGQATVTVTSAAGDSETLTLNEDEPNSGRFSGQISSVGGAPSNGDATLQVADNDTITATYMDADDGSGSPATVTREASIICEPRIAVQPASHDFGSLAVNATQTFTFTVTNTGTGSLSGEASVQAPYAVVSGSPYTLSQDATASVTVRFTPTAESTFNATLNFTGAGGATATLTGSARASVVVCAAYGYSSEPVPLDLQTVAGDFLALAAMMAILAYAGPRRRRTSS